MTTAVATTRRRRKAETAGADVEQLDQADEVAIEPSRVIPPELRFTTDDVPDEEVADEDARTIEFDLDGVTCYIIAPHKLEEVLAQLVEAGARRAKTADQLFAGRRFLERVLRADTIEHLQRRLDDDHDKFRLPHLFEILEKIVNVLDKLLEEENRTRGVRPGQRSAGRGRRR